MCYRHNWEGRGCILYRHDVFSILISKSNSVLGNIGTCTIFGKMTGKVTGHVQKLKGNQYFSHQTNSTQNTTALVSLMIFFFSTLYTAACSGRHHRRGQVGCQCQAQIFLVSPEMPKGCCLRVDYYMFHHSCWEILTLMLAVQLIGTIFIVTCITKHGPM